MLMQISVDRFLRSGKSHLYNLNTYDRILMMMLAAYMGKNDHCFPNYEMLMQDCAMAKATLRKSIKKLQDCGLLIVEQKRVQGKYKMSNRYYLSSSLHEPDNDSQVHLRSFSSSSQGNSQVHLVNSNINNNITNNINTEKPVDNFKNTRAEILHKEWLARQKQ